MVEIINTSNYYIPIKKTKLLIEKFLNDYHQKDWNISVAILDRLEVKKINNKYRGLNRTTDVLSFNLGVINKQKQGEIIVDIEEIRKKSNYKDIFNFRPSYQYLFNFVIIHSLLHLLGYTDDREKDYQEMLYLGKLFLDKIS